MKVDIVEVPGLGYVARCSWFFGLYHTYIDNSDPVRWGSWPKEHVGEAICSTKERAEEMAGRYRAIKSL